MCGNHEKTEIWVVFDADDEVVSGQFTSYDEAIADAEETAIQYPGNTFLVLKAVDIVKSEIIITRSGCSKSCAADAVVGEPHQCKNRCGHQHD